MILIRKRVYSYKFSFVIRDFNEESRLRRQQTNLVKQLESSEEEDDIVLEKVYVKKKTKTDDSPQEHSDIFFLIVSEIHKLGLNDILAIQRIYFL